MRGNRTRELLRVVAAIESNLQQMAVQLAEIKQSIAEMVEMEPLRTGEGLPTGAEPGLSPQQHRQQHGSCHICGGDIRLCESYNQR
jgi:hypothetical protein